MKLALLGYGKMGHAVERVAIERGHEVVCIIDPLEQGAMSKEQGLANADVAIEFSTPKTAVQNIRIAWKNNLPIVSGTTGWATELPKLQDELKNNQKALFWSSNFSIGVNLFLLLNKRLAEMLKPYDYEPSITETHHIHKLDAPSGTALTIQKTIEPILERYIPIESIREGEVAGIHSVRYESDADIIEFRHEAKSRRGFALGAVLAAEFIKGKTGFFSMEDLMGF
ncbi:MAG: 4-hydroxy-tetrahydrodipicolinate reductase [Paludibacteraceae bacterium]|nr:4-hydroxy-tetrahydrodipicolinate reductase [Paludibacteraceae bacterium]